MVSVKCEVGACPRGCDVEGFGWLRLASHFRGHLRASCLLCGASLPHRPALRLHKALRCRRRPPLQGRRFRTARDAALSPRPAGLRVKKEALPSPAKPRLVLQASVSSHASTQPMEGWGPRGAAEPWGSEASSDGSSVRLASPLEQSCDECGWEGPAAEAHDCAAVREAVDMEEFLRHQRYHCPPPCHRSFEQPHEAALHIRACRGGGRQSVRMQLEDSEVGGAEQPSKSRQCRGLDGKSPLGQARKRVLVCDACEYRTDQLGNFIRHLSRKHTCFDSQSQSNWSKAASSKYEGNIFDQPSKSKDGKKDTMVENSFRKSEPLGEIKNPQLETQEKHSNIGKKRKKSRMSVAARLSSFVPPKATTTLKTTNAKTDGCESSAEASVPCADALSKKSDAKKQDEVLGKAAARGTGSPGGSSGRGGEAAAVTAVRLGRRVGCPLCGQAFSRPCVLRHHFARRHPGPALHVPSGLGKARQDKAQATRDNSDEKLRTEEKATEAGGKLKKPKWLGQSVEALGTKTAEDRAPSQPVCTMTSSLDRQTSAKPDKPHLSMKNRSEARSVPVKPMSEKPAANPLPLPAKSEPEDTPAAERQISQSAKSQSVRSANSVNPKSSGNLTQAPKTPLTEKIAPQIKSEPEAVTKDRGSVKSKGSFESSKSSKDSTKSSGSAQSCKPKEAPSLAVKSEPEEVPCAGSKGSGRRGGPGQSGDPFVGKYGRSGRWVCPRCAKDFPLRHRKSFVAHAQRRCEVLLTV